MSGLPSLTPDAVIAVLRTNAAELQQSGIRHVSLFSSLARGEANAESDVDLVVELDPGARIGLIRLVGPEQRLAEIVGRPVDLVPEPIEHHRLRASVERERRGVF